MYLYYEIRTGAIAGQSSSPPPAYPGYASIAVAIPPDPDSAYVAGGAVQARVPIDWTAIPADAFVSINEAPATAGVKAPTASGTWRYRAVGKYQGERTFVVQSPKDVEVLLIGQVKTLAAQKKMTAISPGTAKPEEYRLKAPEIAASANVVAAVLNALTAAQAAVQYPTAASEARCSGEPLATVLAGYRAGSAGSDAEVRRLSSIEHTAVKRIRAAKTIADKRAAYAAINWNWA